MTAATLPWGEFDAVFVGGPNWWQNSQDVQRIVDRARDRGLWCHRGRVNSRTRVVQSALRGFNSTDGTYLVFRPTRGLPEVEDWVASANRVDPLVQQHLF